LQMVGELSDGPTLMSTRDFTRTNSITAWYPPGSFRTSIYIGFCLPGGTVLFGAFYICLNYKAG
jgi:hypothetical protein